MKCVAENRHFTLTFGFFTPQNFGSVNEEHDKCFHQEICNRESSINDVKLGSWGGSSWICENYDMEEVKKVQKHIFLTENKTA